MRKYQETQSSNKDPNIIQHNNFSLNAYFPPFAKSMLNMPVIIEGRRSTSLTQQQTNNPMKTFRAATIVSFVYSTFCSLTFTVIVLQNVKSNQWWRDPYVMYTFLWCCNMTLIAMMLVKAICWMKKTIHFTNKMKRT